MVPDDRDEEGLATDQNLTQHESTNEPPDYNLEEPNSSGEATDKDIP